MTVVEIQNSNNNNYMKKFKFKNSSYLVSHQNNDSKLRRVNGLSVLQKCALLLSIVKGVQRQLPVNALNTNSLKTVPPVVFGIENFPSPYLLVAETLATNMSPER